MDYDSQYNDRPYNDRYSEGAYDDRPPRQPADPPLVTEKIITERKVFFLDLKENSRGRVLKITEDVRGRRDTIMVPAETLLEFYEALGRIIDYERNV
jgi:hypothetical protein